MEHPSPECANVSIKRIKRITKSTAKPAVFYPTEFSFRRRLWITSTIILKPKKTRLLGTSTISVTKNTCFEWCCVAAVLTFWSRNGKVRLVYFQWLIFADCYEQKALQKSQSTSEVWKVFLVSVLEVLESSAKL